MGGSRTENVMCRQIQNNLHTDKIENECRQKFLLRYFDLNLYVPHCKIDGVAQMCRIPRGASISVAYRQWK